MTAPQFAFLLFTLLLGTGYWLALVRPKSRGNVKRNTPEHLQAMARYHAKIHENDSRSN